MDFGDIAGMECCLVGITFLPFAYFTRCYDQARRWLSYTIPCMSIPLSFVYNLGSTCIDQLDSMNYNVDWMTI